MSSLASPPPLPCSSPPKNLPHASVEKQPEKRVPLPKTKEREELQRLKVATNSERPQVEAFKATDSDPAVLESSPLSEPIPLPATPEIPKRQDGMEESSSVDIDDEFTSEAADDIATALRLVVKAREGKDLQTRNERYEPILRANHSLLDPPGSRISTSNEEVIREVMDGPLYYARLQNRSAVSQTLRDRFTKRAEDMTARIRRLRAEYKSYHDRWVTNCRKLDESMASSASQGVEGLLPPSGRVTRRSTNFGDAVRSDLEMEQIIASLDNEDMTDPNVLAIRNTAVIPNLISTDPFTIDFSYDDNNGLVDDPGNAFDVYDSLGRWTDAEKDIYLQKYGLYPKQFSVIASFLPGKTAAQCVMFYYLHKKELIDFRGAIAKYGPKRKRRGGRKAGKGKGNALLADIVKPSRAHGDEESAFHKHRDRFGVVPNLDGRRFPSRRPIVLQESEGGPSRLLSDITAPRGSRVTALQQVEDHGSDADSSRSIRQPPRIHGRGGRLSPSEGGGEIGTVVVAPTEDRRKRQARFVDPIDEPLEQAPSGEEPSKKASKRLPGRPPKRTKDRVKPADKEDGSPRQKTVTSYTWSKGEAANYVELISRLGKDFEKIAAEMPAKTAVQCRNYFRSHAKELDLERLARGSHKTTSANEVAGRSIVSASAAVWEILIYTAWLAVWIFSKRQWKQGHEVKGRREQRS